LKRRLEHQYSVVSFQRFEGLPMSTSLTVVKQFAPPALRDKFLIALDEKNYSALEEARSYLVKCDNFLPSGTCASLGLKPGSTYGDGAEAVRHIIALAHADASLGNNTNLELRDVTPATPYEAAHE
jgi:hypothetical protein